MGSVLPSARATLSLGILGLASRAHKNVFILIYFNIRREKEYNNSTYIMNRAAQIIFTFIPMQL